MLAAQMLCISAPGSAHISTSSPVPAKHHKPVPGDADTNHRQIKAMAKNLAFSSLWGDSSTPSRGLQLVPMAGSLSCTSFSHKQVTCNLGAARSGTTFPSLAHLVFIPLCHLRHSKSRHLSTPLAFDQPQGSAPGHAQTLFHFHCCTGINPKCPGIQSRPHHADPATNTSPLISWGPREEQLPLREPALGQLGGEGCLYHNVSSETWPWTTGRWPPRDIPPESSRDILEAWRNVWTNQPPQRAG